jgi:hypothetical protein
MKKYHNLTKENEDYDISRLNIDYIKGLFDAEGHIFLSYKKINNEIKFTKGVYMKITQKNHPKIIDEIHKFLNFGIKYRNTRIPPVHLDFARICCVA